MSLEPIPVATQPTQNKYPIPADQAGKIAASDGNKIEEAIPDQIYDQLYREDEDKIPPLYHYPRADIKAIRKSLAKCKVNGKLHLKLLYKDWEKMTGDKDMTKEAFDALFGSKQRDGELDNEFISPRLFLRRLIKQRYRFAKRRDFFEFRRSDEIIITSKKLRSQIKKWDMKNLPHHYSNMWDGAEEYASLVSDALKEAGFMNEDEAELTLEIFTDSLVAEFKKALENIEETEGLFADYSLEDIDFTRADVCTKFNKMLRNFVFNKTLPGQEELAELRKLSEKAPQYPIRLPR